MILIRRIVGNSMLPTLRPGSIVIGWSKPRRFKVGDVVIIEHNGREKIKRISELRDDQVFLLGDNPVESKDSRHFGWLDVGAVRARLLWPRYS